MFRRVADALAEPDRGYGADDEQVKETAQRFFEIMATLEYLPNSPTLMNAGTGTGTLSACFVLPLADSMEGIMGAAHDAAMVQKFGGGTGFALSETAPEGRPHQDNTRQGVRPHRCAQASVFRLHPRNTRRQTGRRKHGRYGCPPPGHPGIHRLQAG